MPLPRTGRRILYGALYMTSAYCSWKLFNEHLYEFSPCNGPSMFPTLHRYGDTLIVSKRYKHGRGIVTGDIIVFKQPQFSFMLGGKRVIGMPGDYVVVDLQVDGEDREVGERSKMAQVPEGHVWVNGDNLPWSRDSREYGAVPMGLIVGKAIGRAYWFLPGWPRFERIKNPLEGEPIFIP